MTTAVGPCRHCGRLVPVRTVCRAYGYDTDSERNRRDRFVWGLLGGLLVCSVVAAPVGLVLCWKALQHHRAVTREVVTDAGGPAPVSEVVDSVRRRVDSGPERSNGGA